MVRLVSGRWLHFNGKGRRLFDGLVRGWRDPVKGSVHQTFNASPPAFTGNLEVGKGTVTLANVLAADTTQVESERAVQSDGNGGVTGEVEVGLAPSRRGMGAATVSSGPLEMRTDATSRAAVPCPRRSAR